MLTELHITNFVLIEQHSLHFDAGLTVLTGETGAGKSIILDALSLVLGERADLGVIRHGAQRCEISARFAIAPSCAAHAWLVEQQLDADDDCLLRRVLSLDGKSRATINGIAVTLQQLRQLAELLVNIHGQHEHQALVKRHCQRQLLDRYGRHPALLKTVQLCYQQWFGCQQLLAQQRNLNEQHARCEFLQFQLDEWQRLGLVETDIDALEQEHTYLAKSGDRLNQVQQAYARLNGEAEHNIPQAMHSAQQLLHALSDTPALANALAALDSAAIQVSEACSDLQHYLDHTELNPERFNELDALLQQVHHLARKHRVKPSELASHYQGLHDELQQLQAAEQQSHLAEQRLAEYLAAYQSAAAQLTLKRQAAAIDLSRAIQARMQTLAMHGGQFHIHFDDSDPSTPQPHGAETCEFQVSANPGQPLQALSKVASGGELSRISLAIQVILADAMISPSLIFDEVDVGIGGATAAIVGQLLRSLSQHAQVLCVTHLAQVAACGHQHYQIAKMSESQKTTTSIQALTHEARQLEIARMLGGLQVTEQSLAHAKELLDAAHQHNL